MNISTHHYLLPEYKSPRIAETFEEAVECTKHDENPSYILFPNYDEAHAAIMEGNHFDSSLQESSGAMRDKNLVLAVLDELREKSLYMSCKTCIENDPECEDTDMYLETVEAIEEKYGRENLSFTQYEWGVLQGRITTIEWLLGGKWEEGFEL